jgi:predicted RNase H-like nuclease (RuvC/YqgF family)
VKIKYNKEKSGKQLGGGGPRDRQLAHRFKQEDRLIEKLKPAISAEVAKAQEGPQAGPDLSQYLPMEIARQKIEEAVEYTKKLDKERYESGLKNLNDQLKAARKKAALAEEELINANAEIRRLKDQVTSTPTVSEEAREQLHKKDLEIKDREIKIARLESTLKSKEEAERVVNELQNKLDRLYNKIADGSISPLVGSKMDRPELEDKIFIDPIDHDQEHELDSHIDVKEESTEERRDMKGDLEKLRRLLKM